MLTDQLQQLQATKAHVAELEQKDANERKQALAACQTGAEISAAVGLSPPSIQAIKKSLGLVKARNPSTA